MVDSILGSSMYGMDAASRVLSRTAQRVSNPDRSLQAPERDAVDRSVSMVTYRANAAVFRTGDEMLGTLLNIVA